MKGRKRGRRLHSASPLAQSCARVRRHIFGRYLFPVDDTSERFNFKFEIGILAKFACCTERGLNFVAVFVCGEKLINKRLTGVEVDDVAR